MNVVEFGPKLLKKNVKLFSSGRICMQHRILTKGASGAGVTEDDKGGQASQQETRQRHVSWHRRDSEVEF